MPDDEVPTVEHDVAIAPVVGIAIVPVTPPVGAGLTPSVVISVESSGIPVAPTDPTGPMPSGEVVPSEGIAVSGSTTSTWANAGLAHSNGQAVATIKKRFMEVSPICAELADLSGETIGGSHELRTDRIPDRRLQNLVDHCHRGTVDVPADDIDDRCELIGPARAP
jgi:hypothetical protein